MYDRSFQFSVQTKPRNNLACVHYFSSYPLNVKTFASISIFIQCLSAPLFTSKSWAKRTQLRTLSLSYLTDSMEKEKKEEKFGEIICNEKIVTLNIIIILCRVTLFYIRYLFANWNLLMIIIYYMYDKTISQSFIYLFIWCI